MRRPLHALAGVLILVFVLVAPAFRPASLGGEIRYAGPETGLILVQGLPVLQLHGTAEERGFAHGWLVGEQIIDFFEFYVLADS